jgi:hypothetical protein
LRPPREKKKRSLGSINEKKGWHGLANAHNAKINNSTPEELKVPKEKRMVEKEPWYQYRFRMADQVMLYRGFKKRRQESRK